MGQLIDICKAFQNNVFSCMLGDVYYMYHKSVERFGICCNLKKKSTFYHFPNDRKETYSSVDSRGNELLGQSEFSPFTF